MINETISSGEMWESKLLTAKVWATNLEDSARQQILNVLRLPFIFSHVAIMPDAHFGMGATIGSVIATKGAIIPSAIGVDIGCGMCAVRLPFKIDKFGDNLSAIRSSIERSVPVGFNQHEHIKNKDIFINLSSVPTFLINEEKIYKKSFHQMGTLGGGNHFIEVCQDTENNAWVMLHSGSRNVGKTLADYHINKAKSIMKDYFIEVPHPDLSYFVEKTPEFQEYIHDLHWSQLYAKQNRNEMMRVILKDISHHVYGEDIGEEKMTEFRVDCHHNYAQMENHFGQNVWVTRKGAVSAREGEFGIIPGSMGAKSFIVKGLGNPNSFYSCSHGAGRKMSRTMARKIFNETDLSNQTLGIECRKDSGVVDEIPSAYKDIDEVMNNQSDLAEKVYELKQLICIKG